MNHADLTPCYICHGHNVTLTGWCITCNDCGRKFGFSIREFTKDFVPKEWNNIYKIMHPEQYQRWQNDWVFEQIVLEGRLVNES